MAFVTDYNNRRIAPGQTFTIFGGFFDGSCSVKLGGTEASIVDYDEEKIEVLAPIDLGEYDVTLVDGEDNEINVGSIAVLNLADTPKRNAPKDYTQAEFFNYTISLLPRGKAFAMWNGSIFRKLITAIASSFKYTWDTIKAMVDSVDPTHTENIEEWEQELNLPVLGIYPSTLDGRRAEIYRVECLNGGCSVEYFKQILSLMNIYSDVWEYTKNPEKFSTIDFGRDDPRFFSKVDFYLEDYEFTDFEAGISCAGDCLLDFPLHAEVDVLNQIKPSHTKIVFGYNKNEIKVGENNYKFKKIGKLLWTTSNLDEDVGNNCYFNNDSSKSRFGKFYKYDVSSDMEIVNNVSALLSNGWRVPTMEDWVSLLGEEHPLVLDKCSVGEWGDEPTTNTTGFSALASGIWYYGWRNQGSRCMFLSSTRSEESGRGFVCVEFKNETINGLRFHKASYGSDYAQIRLCKNA